MGIDYQENKKFAREFARFCTKYNVKATIRAD